MINTHYGRYKLVLLDEIVHEKQLNDPKRCHGEPHMLKRSLNSLYLEKLVIKTKKKEKSHYLRVFESTFVYFLESFFFRVPGMTQDSSKKPMIIVLHVHRYYWKGKDLRDERNF